MCAIKIICSNVWYYQRYYHLCIVKAIQLHETKKNWRVTQNKMKQELQVALIEIQKEIWNFKAQKESEIKKLNEEKCQPLLDKANELRWQIANDMDEKYKNDFAPLYEKQKELQDSITKCDLEIAQTLWYPHGTKVTLYETRRYQTGYNKSTITGTVQIYDGSQNTPLNMTRYSLPSKGDLCVFYNKKDGTMGTRFDIISQYGKLKQWHPMWLIDGETPENNIKNK